MPPAYHVPRNLVEDLYEITPSLMAHEHDSLPTHFKSDVIRVEAMRDNHTHIHGTTDLA